MASDENSCTSENHRLCANGCGFFGSAANQNLCSKCYRDFRIREAQAVSAKAALAKSLKSCPSVSSLDDDCPIITVAEPSSSSSKADSLRSERSVRSRCWSCKKRVGLTGFNCRCGSTFCGAHRYPEEHRCTFDFKTVGRDAISMANPVVKADKVERI